MNGSNSSLRRLFEEIKRIWRVPQDTYATSGGPGWTLGSPARSGPRRVCGGALLFLIDSRPQCLKTNRLGGTRTLNAQFEPRILSPLRLPIPPRAQGLTLPTPEENASPKEPHIGSGGFQVRFMMWILHPEDRRWIAARLGSAGSASPGSPEGGTANAANGSTRPECSALSLAQNPIHTKHRIPLPR